MNVRTCCDLDEAGRVWRELWPAEDVFGCWEARECFRKTFGRPFKFFIAESRGRPAGFLALSHIEEEGYWGQFPGETWKGRTWFEQNRIPAQSDILRMMLWEAAPESTSLRYLEAGSAGVLPDSVIDETGYIFSPRRYGYDLERYWSAFSGKSRKRITQEIESLGPLDYRHGRGDSGDIDWLFDTNRANFGADSYFEDARFLSGFDDLVSLLSEKGLLHVLTVSSGGRRAAVDVGAVFGDRYTVLAGATDPEFRGVAKAANLAHIGWACDMRIESVDFLCGDFGWKERFHLEPRPLFVSRKPVSPEFSDTAHGTEAEIVASS